MIKFVFQYYFQHVARDRREDKTQASTCNTSTITTINNSNRTTNDTTHQEQNTHKIFCSRAARPGPTSLADDAGREREAKSQTKKQHTVHDNDSNRTNNC